MKQNLRLLSALLVLMAISFSCKEKVTPLKDRLSKSWVARIVKEDGNQVYSRGGSSNTKPGYDSFKLTLSSSGSATLVDINQTFSGTFTATESAITLSGLTPEPTGSNGTLVYNIVSFPGDNSELQLKMNEAYPKTGNTINEYTLVPQQ